MKSRLRQWNRLLVVWLVCVASVAAFYFLIVVPQKWVIQNQADEIARKAQKVDFLQHFSSPKVWNRSLAEMEELRKMHASMLFPKDSLNSLDLRINEAAMSSHLTDFSCRDITPDLGSQFSKLKLLGQRKLRSSFGCSFTNFFNFINALERQQPLVLISEFTLRHVSDTSEQLAGDVELVVLYLIPK